MISFEEIQSSGIDGKLQANGVGNNHPKKPRALYIPNYATSGPQDSIAQVQILAKSFDIYKLNSTADDYIFKAAFKVDFDSYLIKDYYSEFALKSDSCIDYYNEVKGLSKNFTGVTALTIPTTQKFINYI